MIYLTAFSGKRYIYKPGSMSRLIRPAWFIEGKEVSEQEFLRWEEKQVHNKKFAEKLEKKVNE